tara:strand:+ start:95 stop:433 length:339 start_codon:yes stop_codon:yes gene_type:complete
MDPFHKHWSLDFSVTEGNPLILTFVAVSLHGDMVTGTHGMGDPAAATAGLTVVVHMPKGMIFKKGTLSISFAVGNPAVVTPLIGRTTNGVGTVPQEHFRILFIQDAFDINLP